MGLLTAALAKQLFVESTPAMHQERWLALLKQHRAIAVIRAPTFATGIAMAEAVAAGGFRLLEVTWNSHRPADLLRQLRQSLPPDCVVGAGTVLSCEALQAAVAAGARFCFSPHTDAALIQSARAQGIPMIPGALTPTEIAQAWQLGASSVKVFPAQALGGVAYIRHLQGPLGHIPLVPTGGVTVENGPALLAAGAAAIGLSSSLFPKSLIANQNWDAIEQRSRQLLQRSGVAQDLETAIPS